MSAAPERWVCLGSSDAPAGVVELGKLNFIADLVDVAMSVPTGSRFATLSYTDRWLRGQQPRRGDLEALEQGLWPRHNHHLVARRWFLHGQRCMASRLGAAGWPSQTDELLALARHGLDTERWGQATLDLTAPFDGFQRLHERRLQARVWRYPANPDQGVLVPRIEITRRYVHDINPTACSDPNGGNELSTEVNEMELNR